MGIENLMQAFQQFGQAAQEYGAYKGIEDATAAVTELNKNTQLKFADRQAAQGEIANQLQARLASLGAPNTQIQAAVGALAPKQISTSMDAYKAAQAATNPEDKSALLKLQAEFARAEAEPQILAQAPALKNAKEIAAANNATQLAIAGIKKGTASREMTPGEKALDRNFASDYNKWTDGGFATSQDAISTMDAAISKLTDDSNLTGPLVSKAPDVFRQEGAALRQDIQRVTQAGLKSVLGAQFTEREGELFLARAYDERLSPALNREKLEKAKAVLQAMADAKQQKAAYFEQNGTLAGFKGTDFTKGASVQILEQAMKGIEPQKAVQNYIDTTKGKPATQAPAKQEEFVDMLSPSGRPARVPRSQVEAAKAAGGKLISK